jgi:hypothetical protein
MADRQLQPDAAAQRPAHDVSRLKADFSHQRGDVIGHQLVAPGLVLVLAEAVAAQVYGVDPVTLGHRRQRLAKEVRGVDAAMEHD